MVVNTVSSVKSLRIYAMSRSELLEIKRRGRPLPQLGKLTERPIIRTLKEFEWMCVCNVRWTYFCFPCLLFRRGASQWTRGGYRRLLDARKTGAQHARTVQHLKSCVRLATLEEAPETRRFKRSKRDLSIMIDRLREDCCDDLGDKKVADDLLRCCLTVCRGYIRDELRGASVAAMIADDTKRESEDPCSVLVFRYAANGSIRERFWSIYKTDLSSTILKKHLRSIFYKNEKKLIAQTYGGNIDIKIYEIVKENYRNAHLVHTASILESVSFRSNNVEARIFFCHLIDFADFFATSPDRLLSCLDRVQESNPKPVWNLKTDILGTLHDNVDALRASFGDLKKGDYIPTVVGSSQLCDLLSNEEFARWLKFFHSLKIPLLNDRRGRGLQCERMRQNLKESIIEMNARIANSTDEVTKSICSALLQEMKLRLIGLASHIVAEDLLAALLCDSFDEETNKRLTAEVMQSYPMLKTSRLITELRVLHGTPQFSNFETVLKLWQTLLSYKLAKVFPSVCLLAKIIVTTPTYSQSTIMPKIKNLLKTNDRPNKSAQTMLTIHKDLIDSHSEFNAKVIEKYIKLLLKRTKM